MFLFDEKILQQISKLEDGDLESYISSRVKSLEENTTENRESIEPEGSNKTALSHGFIPKTTEIYAESGGRSIAVGGFLLNDNSIYEILINNLKSQKDIQSLGDILQSIQSSIDEYFGGLALEENEENRRNLYSEIENKYDEFEPYSISEYRNNNTALCAERAAIAQNMLAFLGADTYYMVGHLSRNDGMTNLNHAYNCIVDKEYGSGIVVDFTNPILRETSNEMYVYHSNIINKEWITEILSGKSSVEIDRPEFYMQNEKEMRKIVHCRYSLNELTKGEVSKLQSEKSSIEEVEVLTKSTQDLGKETIDVQKETSYLDETQEGIISQQKDISNEKKQQEEL